jgi:hypothetical protein
MRLIDTENLLKFIGLEKTGERHLYRNLFLGVAWEVLFHGREYFVNSIKNLI